MISIDNTHSDFKLIILSGEALNDPVVVGGPFVMNSKEELREASRNYREVRFGSEDF